MSIYAFTLVQNFMVLSASASILIFADGLWKIGGLFVLGCFTVVTKEKN